MDKKIYTLRYQTFLAMLKEARAQTGLAQRPFAKLLGVHQTYISKVEVGERRLDIAELSFWCEALGISFDEFMNEWHVRYMAAEIAAKSIRSKKTIGVAPKSKTEAKPANKAATKAVERKTRSVATPKAPARTKATAKKTASPPVKRPQQKFLNGNWQAGHMPMSIQD